MNTKDSNMYFGVGIATLLLGVFLFMTFWLMYFGFACLLLGATIVILSKKNWKYKFAAIALPVGFVSFAVLSSLARPEIYLIPEGFRGPIYVVFDQERGQAKEYDGLRRTYRIPETGVLFTQFERNEGILNQKFFFVTKAGERKEIGVLDVRDYNDETTINPSPTEPPRDSLAVFNPGQTGKMSISNEDEEMSYTALTVGTYSEIERLNYLAPSYIDSLKKEKEN